MYLLQNASASGVSAPGAPPGICP